MSAKAAQYVVQGFCVIPSNVPVSRALLRAFTTSQTTRQRKSLLSEAGILSSQKPKQSNSCGKKPVLFSHLNVIYAFHYQIRERHACTRDQLTWLDCFEQKYLSIYISFSGKPF